MVRMPNKAETPARVQELQRQLRELFASADQSARTAQSSANTAQSTATTAQSTATTAQTTATAAQTTATTANTAAQTAQTAAQQASTDAATANTNASTAQTAAQTAQQQAQAAQQAAAAKTKTTWSTAVPDNTQNPGTTDGDVWYVTNGTGGNATAQYRWSTSNSQWLLTPIDGTALRNVIADTVKAGAVDGQVITGTLLRSSTPGNQRVEVQSNRMDIFASGATTPAASLIGVQGAAGTTWTQFDIVHSSSSIQGKCSFVAPRGWSTDVTDQTMMYNVQLSHGVRTPMMLLSGYVIDSLGNTVLDLLNSAGSTLTIRNIVRRASNGTFPAVLDGNSSGWPRLNANEFRWLKSTGTTPVAQVVIGNASNGGARVTADEFYTQDGNSIIPADSGWLVPTVAINSGYSVNTLRYRKIGNRVEWTGQLNRNANMASQTNVINVPTAYAPSVPSGGTTRIFSATGTAGTAFRFNFNTNGTIDIRDIANGTTTYAILDGITYLTD